MSLYSLVARFRDLYATDLTPVQRIRAKKSGLAGARLFVHPDYQEHGFHWWLLFTDGEHPAKSREKSVITPTSATV